MFSSAYTVFALGLRHGADPDHLAAIDNLTRNSVHREPLWSRFVGTLFASGHTIMVLAIAAFVGYLGSRFASHATTIEAIGTWVSIVVLLVIAGLNVQQLASGTSDCVLGAKFRLLPRVLRETSNPWLAVPIGLLFGFGFETSSQVAAYAVVFGTDAGVLGAMLVGWMFCLGMVTTDTLDSIMVHRLVSHCSGKMAGVMRTWIWSVTLFAIAVAAYEFAQVLGWTRSFPDIAVSAILVGALLAIFLWVRIKTRVVPSGHQDAPLARRSAREAASR